MSDSGRRQRRHSQYAQKPVQKARGPSARSTFAAQSTTPVYGILPSGPAFICGAGAGGGPQMRYEQTPKTHAASHVLEPRLEQVL